MMHGQTKIKFKSHNDEI